jgi:hypothetical protein
MPRCAPRSASLGVDSTPRPAGQLLGRIRRASQDGSDLVERDGEHVVQHEGESLGRRQLLEHDEQGQPDGVGQHGLLLGVGALGRRDDRIRQLRVHQIFTTSRA